MSDSIHTWVYSSFALLEVEKWHLGIWNDHRKVSAVLNYVFDVWNFKLEPEFAAQAYCRYTGTEKTYHNTIVFFQQIVINQYYCTALFVHVDYINSCRITVPVYKDGMLAPQKQSSINEKRKLMIC